jgi:hypothetical protein
MGMRNVLLRTENSGEQFWKKLGFTSDFNARRKKKKKKMKEKKRGGWINMAQRRYKWRAAVNRPIKLRFPYNTGNLINSWKYTKFFKA